MIWFMCYKQLKFDITKATLDDLVVSRQTIYIYFLCDVLLYLERPYAFSKEVIAFVVYILHQTLSLLSGSNRYGFKLRNDWQILIHYSELNRCKYRISVFRLKYTRV